MRHVVVAAGLVGLMALAGGAEKAPDKAPDTASGQSPREGPAVLKADEHRVGNLIDDVTFTDLDAKPGRLSDFRGRPLVVCLTSVSCPVAKRYAPVLADLEKHYRDRGVAFLFVNPSAEQSPEAMRAAKRDAGMAGRYVHDAEGRLARALGAESSTDVFVLDGARTLVYRGAADDQFGIGYNLAQPRRRYLAEAIDAALAGTSLEVAATSAPGCALELKPVPPADAAPAAAPAVTYHNRVSRIVQQHCVDCHRAGENAPFALTSYTDVKANLGTVKRVVTRGLMPPWFPDPKTGHWANDRSLSERDRTDLLAWVAAGAPEGDAADAPLERKFVQGWKIGTPDAVFETPRTFSIPATGAMDYQRVAVQTHLAEDKWVKAIEIRPSSPQVVHHVLVFVVYPPNHPRLNDQPQYKDGLDGYFAGLVPGQGHAIFPKGLAKFLPKEALLIFQIHYTPNGTATTDRPKIGLIFSDKAPEHEITTRGVFNTRFRIPPGDGNYEITATHYFRNPVRLLSFNPHSHVRGKAYRYELQYPGGKKETVLDLPRYDFNWQMEYVLRDPIDVPAGARLRVTAWYDNSEKNPANPDPTATVHFGDQTWDEMMIGYFSGYRLP
jgi:mono/diheme cytochrome c family protein